MVKSVKATTASHVLPGYEFVFHHKLRRWDEKICRPGITLNLNLLLLNIIFYTTPDFVDYTWSVWAYTPLCASIKPSTECCPYVLLLRCVKVWPRFSATVIFPPVQCFFCFVFFSRVLTSGVNLFRSDHLLMSPLRMGDLWNSAKRGTWNLDQVFTWFPFRYASEITVKPIPV